jgi:hypothetical protein
MLCYDEVLRYNGVLVLLTYLVWGGIRCQGVRLILFDIYFI